MGLVPGGHAEELSKELAVEHVTKPAEELEEERVAEPN